MEEQITRAQFDSYNEKMSLMRNLDKTENAIRSGFYGFIFSFYNVGFGTSLYMLSNNLINNSGTADARKYLAITGIGVMVAGVATLIPSIRTIVNGYKIKPKLEATLEFHDSYKK